MIVDQGVIHYQTLESKGKRLGLPEADWTTKEIWVDRQLSQKLRQFK